VSGGVGVYVAQVDRVLAAGQGLFPASGPGPGGVDAGGPDVPAPPPQRSQLTTGVRAAGDGYRRTWDAAAGFDDQTNTAAGQGSGEGRAGWTAATGVRQSAASAAVAIAPATGTPAGVKALVSSMDERLAAMQRQIESTKAQNQLLAARLRHIAMAYRAAAAAPTAMPGGMPMTGGGSGAGMLSGVGSAASPASWALRTLTQPANPRNRANTGTERLAGSDMPPISGEGATNVRRAIRAALDVKGVTNPVARARWEAGMMLVVDRESDFRNVVNLGDFNARAGNPSGGPFQFTRTTFTAYHEPGTPTNFRDTFAQACAFINYARAHYGVAADGSDLAVRIQQADPWRPPRGY
jgi:hypothetical protein